MTAGARPAARSLGRAVALVLRCAVVAYQWTLSPVLGANCRFEPSCSHYAVEALDRHGPLAGSWLALRRVLRCNPWGGCGYDPVPDPAPERKKSPATPLGAR